MPRTATKSKSKLKAIVVTTLHKGIFFGYSNAKTDAKIVRIEQARNCLYWSSDIKGFLGLASSGPSKNCKIGLAVPALTLQDVTSISECSDEAIAAWEKGPWS